jgi:hypothetical protein
VDPKKYKVLFYSEDGVNFRLFCEGKELAITRGVRISASVGNPVEVDATLAFIEGMETIKDSEGTEIYVDGSVLPIKTERK